MERQTADATGASRRCVWIVDDSPLDTERARRALDGDYAIRTFDDGTTALEALTAPDATLPDVLVLDWLMPGVSGLDVCRYLRGAPDDGLRRIGVLLLTVHQRTQQVVEGLDAGANDFLSKPYAEAELRARVGVLVRNRQLLERAERAESALAHLLANSPDPLLGLDDCGRVAYANPEARHVLGALRGELVGLHIEHVLPALRGWSVDDDDDQTERRPSRPDLELGDQIFAPAVRLASTGENVTRVVSLRNVTLQRSAERRRLDFYSVVAHDLRSPLSATLLRLEVMLRGGSGQLAPTVHANLLKMQRNMRELIAMINDFLDLARYESGIQLVGDTIVDVASVIEETVEDSRPLVDASELGLRVELDTTSLEVRGDRHRLKQVIGNLLANAIKFTPAGGTVTVTGCCADGHAVVAVKDTGRGIDPARLPTIFERYSRALDDEHEVVGSGLGLMIVREIVRAHQGTVEVESARGLGSTFRLKLPLVRRDDLTDR